MVVTEIAPDVYRLSIFVPDFNLQFNHFLVKDDEPLLFHTGMRRLFPELRDALAHVIDPATLRWIAFSHFESDECGALNDWLAIAPKAEPACSLVGALVSVNDFASRPARGLADDEVVSTGRYRLRFLKTPHVPHCWEAGMLLEETQRTLFCSDVMAHGGDGVASTTSDIVGIASAELRTNEHGPFAQAYPYTAYTDATLRRLAALEPRTLALMHGTTFTGDGRRVLDEFAGAMREILGPAPDAGAGPARAG